MAFRYILVSFVCGLAIGIPFLGDFISLIGAMASSMLALITPPLIDQLIIRQGEHNRYFIIKTAKNI